MKIRMTATWEYEPRPGDYPGGASPAFMMETDQEGYRGSGLVEYIRSLSGDDFEVVITGEVVQ
jgi:hypothetical protein